MLKRAGSVGRTLAIINETERAKFQSLMPSERPVHQEQLSKVLGKGSSKKNCSSSQKWLC